MKKDWTYKKLGEICEIQYGTRVVQSRDGGSIYPVYGGGGPTFKMDTYNREDCLVVARFAMSKQCTRYVKGKFFLNDSGLTLEPKDKESLLQSYLDKCILGLNDDIYFVAKGMAQKNLDMKSFKELPIKYPTSTSEQQQIVAELDLLSGVIEKQKAQLEELDKLAQSIFYDMFGDPVTNEKGWLCKKLKSIAIKIGSGATPRGGNQSYKNEGISLIRSMNVHNNEFVYDDLAFIDDEQAAQLNNVKVESKDVLLNITGASVARCCIVPDGILPARVNQHVCIIRPIKELVDNVYLNRFFTSNEEQSLLLSLSRSNAATREALPKNLLENCIIPLPPLTLQQEFAAKVEAIEAMKAKVRQSLKEAETLFNSRMDYYFN